MRKQDAVGSKEPEGSTVDNEDTVIIMTRTGLDKGAVKKEEEHNTRILQRGSNEERRRRPRPAGLQSEKNAALPLHGVEHNASPGHDCLQPQGAAQKSGNDSE
ncbi:hypothetical protein BAUCODRAFT_333057 [Baudoinia panamericana UAMH 10762]|uniref:Uncharacterized protein n=1 Tax=Baudoinia panamericana (strain UAMH 10762) TaxID=717646 RepID=M2MWP9_BAUPA|nr:uncharacterized protein BAUCODRAFT_333057 [Baudoinia panamericana UAMH 10762]EMC91004.1 hypothetical protein BAUCODRAFT_333057 [Baudoinia panamericana UAMH 10762]